MQALACWSSVRSGVAPLWWSLFIAYVGSQKFEAALLASCTLSVDREGMDVEPLFVGSLVGETPLWVCCYSWESRVWCRGDHVLCLPWRCQAFFVAFFA